MSKRPLEHLGEFKYEACKVVAEIGCNHMGSLETAKELMLLAKKAGAHYAKFQKRCPKELLTEDQYHKPHPVPTNAYGPTYGAHREFLEFSVEQHRELWEYGKEIGIEWATSTWDSTSAREMITIPCDFLKVPSACNNHFEMLKVLRDEYKGDVHVSTGMTTRSEIEDVIRYSLTHSHTTHSHTTHSHTTHSHTTHSSHMSELISPVCIYLLIYITRCIFSDSSRRRTMQSQDW